MRLNTYFFRMNTTKLLEIQTKSGSSPQIRDLIYYSGVSANPIPILPLDTPRPRNPLSLRKSECMVTLGSKFLTNPSRMLKIKILILALHILRLHLLHPQVLKKCTLAFSANTQPRRKKALTTPHNSSESRSRSGSQAVVLLHLLHGKTPPTATSFC